MGKNTVRVVADDGLAIAVHRWETEFAPRGVILISHGMGEYAMRYDRFAETATRAGFSVWAPDHRGHGETAGSLSRLGHLADRKGFPRVVEDFRLVAQEARRLHPSAPFFVLGHSFGSLVALSFIERYGDDIAGCVLVGTIGPRPFASRAGIALAGLVSAFRGKRRPSPFLQRVTFGSYNRRVVAPASPNSWLSRDAAEVERYDSTPWSGFVSTAGFFRDLSRGLRDVHRPRAIARIPKDLPIFVASGGDDPVGRYGEGPTRLVRSLIKGGAAKTSLRVYRLARHELVNELNRDEITSDLIAWIDARTRERAANGSQAGA